LSGGHSGMDIHRRLGNANKNHEPFIVWRFWFWVANCLDSWW
jgi:di/tripeptidase